MSKKSKYNKSQLMADLSAKTEIPKKKIALLFAELQSLAVGQLKKSGTFTVPGMVKLVTKRKPARPAGERLDPFTKQMKMFKAKPASTTVKARALSGVKNPLK